MPYQIIDASANNFSSIGLGISTQTLFSSNYNTIDQAIQNLKFLLLTKKGEIIQQPDFGTDLIYALFQPSTDLLKSEIQDYINEAISTWLPSITVEKIEINTPLENPNLQNDIEVKISVSVGFSSQTAELIIVGNQNGTITVESISNTGQ
jgi:phage baseplate assembly protein W